jgi:hypothetical protein
LKRYWLAAAISLGVLACVEEKRPAIPAPPPREPAAPEELPYQPLTKPAEPVASTHEVLPEEWPMGLEVAPEAHLPPVSLASQVLVEPLGETSVSKVRSVEVTATVTGAGAEELGLEIETPQGLPYERRAKPLDGAPGDTQVATFGIPVAGTMIDSSRLAGTWTVKFLMRGKVVSTQTFSLTP